MSENRLLILHARSPLHAGTGQSTSTIDLPIARDRATTHPLLPGSSIKGALRALATDTDTQVPLFGPDTNNASDHAGSMAIGDARLLLLPVRSVSGTFAWVTCPWVITALKREAELCGIPLPKDLPAPRKQEAAVCDQPPSDLLYTTNRGNKVILEDLDLTSLAHPATNPWAKALGELLFEEEDWRKVFAKRFCIVHDDVFTFLSRHATDVVTRVSIDPETGVANDGQLWTEENLPAESILVSILHAHPRGTAAQGLGIEGLWSHFEALLNQPVQLGGKATVGRGRCTLHLQGA